MSLQEQIDEAWKSYCGDAELNPNIHPEKQEGFEDGYRAAMKSLYRDIQLPEASTKAFESVHCQLDSGEWVEPLTGISIDGKIVYSFNLADESAVKIPTERIKRFMELTVPHPSDIFGEEWALFSGRSYCNVSGNQKLCQKVQ